MRSRKQPSKTPHRDGLRGDSSKHQNRLRLCGTDTLRLERFATASGGDGYREAMGVSSGTKTESGVGETVRVVIHALLIALVIRTFLFQPFNIPS
ncbi:MAG TPA: hypothetical protein VFS91_10200, partial [Nitrobacter sp.]|nr:hypothetical protein [Nitrobacter sp.]